jgi:HlyD family secretion protein
MRNMLFDNQTGSRLSVLEARSLRLEVEGDLEQLRRQEAELAHQIEGLRAQRQVFLEDLRRATLEELAEVRSDHELLSEDLRKAEYRRQKVVLTAPGDAVVLDVADRSVGSVVREAEPMFTLVATDQPVEVEVAVDTSDIARVQPGQSARVKLTAYPFQKHGTATGIVRTVSGDAFAPEDGTRLPFYRARIELTDVALRDVPESFRLLPGMTVLAEIHAGHRTVLSYFLYPLLRGLDESVREP